VQPDSTPEPSGLRSTRLDRPFCVLAWVGILLITGLAILGQSIRVEEATEGESPDLTLTLRLAEIQAKYFVGTGSLAAKTGDAPDEQLLDAAKTLDAGPVAQRLRALALVSDLGGPGAGLRSAEELRRLIERHQVQLSPEDVRTFEAIEATLLKRQAEGPATEPDVETADLLRRQLGWFGDLLLTPAQGDSAAREALVRPTQLLVVGVVVLIVGVVALGIAGAIGAVLLLIFGITGHWRAHLTTGRPRGTVYAETFAVWFLLFLVLSIVASLLPRELAPIAGGLAMLASLSALAWPIARGIPFAEMRRDVGLHRGRGFIIEAASGIAAYAMALPLVAVGLTIMFGLMALAGVSMAGGAGEFDVSATPTHPLLEWMGGSMANKLLALVLAAAIAPLVEEVVFRGVLYRHLREGTRRLGAVLSAAASMLLVGLIFAAIHPQGVFAIPVLTALACGFAFAREWRDSLIGPMVAHSINNGAVVCLLMLAFA
jgi:membrane protease YdiL (CAAX protease family)